MKVFFLMEDLRFEYTLIEVAEKSEWLVSYV